MYTDSFQAILMISGAVYLTIVGKFYVSSMYYCFFNFLFGPFLIKLSFVVYTVIYLSNLNLTWISILKLKEIVSYT